jgi:hypothetical protein
VKQQEYIVASSLKLEQILDLKGRIAVVTGGGTGIGWMIAQGLATNGAKGALRFTIYIQKSDN